MTKIQNNPKWKGKRQENFGDVHGYAALATILSREIHGGAFQPGEKLPGARAIAMQYGVGRRVACSALDLLAMKGIVRCKARSGYYVSGEIQPGRRYRIGVFSFGLQPYVCGEILSHIYHALMLRGYSMVYGSDCEKKGGTLKKFLKDNPEIDALLLHGFMTEGALKALSGWRKPYLLMGVYPHLAEKHPCEDGGYEQMLEDSLTESLKPFRGKHVACVLGDRSSPSDRAVMETIRTAIQRSGALANASSLRHADGNGFGVIRNLLKKEKPDVLISIGIFLVAAARLFQEEPELPRPYVIGIGKIDFPHGVTPAVDHFVSLDTYKRIAYSSVDSILRMLEEERTTPSESEKSAIAEIKANTGFEKT